MSPEIVYTYLNSPVSFLSLYNNEPVKNAGQSSNHTSANSKTVDPASGQTLVLPEKLAASYTRSLGFGTNPRVHSTVHVNTLPKSTAVTIDFKSGRGETQRVAIQESSHIGKGFVSNVLLWCSSASQ